MLLLLLPLYETVWISGTKYKSLNLFKEKDELKTYRTANHFFGLDNSNLLLIQSVPVKIKSQTGSKRNLLCSCLNFKDKMIFGEIMWCRISSLFSSAFGHQQKHLYVYLKATPTLHTPSLLKFSSEHTTSTMRAVAWFKCPDGFIQCA